MISLTPDPSSCYLTLRSLEQAGFPYERCIEAVRCLFPDSDDEQVEVKERPFIGRRVEVELETPPSSGWD